MPKETYKVWLHSIQTRIDEPSCQWNRVGIWGFPTKSNYHFHDTMIHYCKEYWKACQNHDGISKQPRDFNKCAACGEMTPDGIKMIALLEKL